MIGIEDMTIINRTKEKPETVQNTMVKSIAQQQMILKKGEIKMGKARPRNDRGPRRSVGNGRCISLY
ncbi:hypothetical protein ACI2OX_03420 [Bacillus sp. N9]